MIILPETPKLINPAKIAKILTTQEIRTKLFLATRKNKVVIREIKEVEKAGNPVTTLHRRTQNPENYHQDQKYHQNPRKDDNASL